MNIKVAVLFGGQSAESEISIKTARFIIDAIDRAKYDVIAIGIDLEGNWHLCKDDLAFGDGVSVTDGALEYLKGVNVAFPVFHGPMGEDGTIQGLLEIAGIPYVGEGVLSSAVNLDKDVSKRLLRDAKISVADFRTYTMPPSYEEVKKALGMPVFVKPNTMGSSIGMTKVKKEAEFREAIDLAFSFDSVIIIEKAIIAREFECSVLQTDEIIVSFPGEVIPTHEFYSYEAKYIDPNGARLVIPANIDQELIDEIRRLSLKAFQTLRCEVIARVDFFLDEKHQLYINELNTLPGFTPISLYPKLLQFSGLSYGRLMDKLIQKAQEIGERRKKQISRNLKVLAP